MLSSVIMEVFIRKQVSMTSVLKKHKIIILWGNIIFAFAIPLLNLIWAKT